MTARPYSPDTLAEHWGCSSEKIRQMCKRGELASFRLGKLYRIPANEVERVECQNTALCGTESNGASPTPTPSEAALESRLARMSGGGQRLSLVKSGATSPSPHRAG
jgi:excisionase family DNA binding protein